jgi:hypothetical protein
MQRLTLMVMAVVLTAGTLTASVLPEPVRNERPDLKLVGQGQYTWFGLSVYEASLWSPDGNFNCCASQHPVVLNLTYRRTIGRDQMTTFTQKEWARLGILDQGTRDAWATRVASIWPEGRAGDTLAALIIPGRETRFYDNHGLLGVVPIPEFGPALLAIWLDPRAKDAQLRAALLGNG